MKETKTTKHTIENAENQKLDIKYLSPRIQLVLTIAGVAVTILNIWIASIMAPLVKDLAVLTSQVQASSSDIKDIQTTYIQRNEWATRNALIDNALGRMEGKIDSILVSTRQ